MGCGVSKDAIAKPSKKMKFPVPKNADNFSQFAPSPTEEITPLIGNRQNEESQENSPRSKSISMAADEILPLEDDDETDLDSVEAPDLCLKGTKCIIGQDGLLHGEDIHYTDYHLPQKSALALDTAGQNAEENEDKSVR